MKELPRIPRVATYEQFLAFAKAGRELGKLHVDFEEVTPYAGVTLEYAKSGQPVLPRQADEMEKNHRKDGKCCQRQNHADLQRMDNCQKHSS